MGLKSWLDDVIPNELKGTVGKIAAVAGAAYLGYKYAPSMYSAAKGFIGQPAHQLPGFPGGLGMEKATGMYGVVETYKDTNLGKFVKGFGQSVAGKALKGESEAEARARFEAEQARINKMMMAKQYNIPGGTRLQDVGTFQASRAAVPGFRNPQVNESLNLMAYFMQDLQDNGRIDSSALYAESTRGTTIKLPSAKSMKMSI